MIRDVAWAGVSSKPAAIPNFNKHGGAEDPQTCDRLDRLNELAADHGWHGALRAVYADDPRLIAYVTDSSRSLFLDLLPIDGATDVLEIGPGLGQFTPLLAKRAKSVACLEVVEGQARFVAERCRQSGVDNVAVACGGDDCRLPYGDRKFDVVVLNLVFEWCGTRDPEGTAPEMQARLLREIHRVLRPGGSVFLTTKNRFGLRYLLGGRDEHLHQLRFGSALPRRLRSCLLAADGETAGHRTSPFLDRARRTLEGMRFRDPRVRSGPRPKCVIPSGSSTSEAIDRASADRRDSARASRVSPTS